MPLQHPLRDLVDWLQVALILVSTLAAAAAAAFAFHGMRLARRSLAASLTTCSFRGWGVYRAGDTISVGGKVGLIPAGSGTAITDTQGIFRLGRHIKLTAYPEDRRRDQPFSGTWEFDVAFVLPGIGKFKDYTELDVEIRLTTQDGGGGVYRRKLPIVDR